MQLRIAHIQDDILAKEEERDELKRRIDQKLRDQDEDKARAKAEHQQDYDNIFAKNQGLAKDLKTFLTTFYELP